MKYVHADMLLRYTAEKCLCEQLALQWNDWELNQLPDNVKSDALAIMPPAAPFAKIHW